MLKAKTANKIIITRTFATVEKHNEDDMYFWTEANGAEIEICHCRSVRSATGEVILRG